MPDYISYHFVPRMAWCVGIQHKNKIWVEHLSNHGSENDAEKEIERLYLQDEAFEKVDKIVAETQEINP